MNQKSKAIELIELIYDNTKVKSNIEKSTIMCNVLNLAIEAKLIFEKDDYNTIINNFNGHSWLGINAYKKGHGEDFYTNACKVGNISFCESYEHFYDFMPFKNIKGKRLYKGASYQTINKYYYQVIGFDFETKKIDFGCYTGDYWITNSGATHCDFNNKEWSKFRRNLE